MDRGTWWDLVHGVAKSWTQTDRLSTLTEGKATGFLEGVEQRLSAGHQFVAPGLDQAQSFFCRTHKNYVHEH